MKKFVITRYKQDYLHWCRDNEVSTRDAVWVGHPNVLRGESIQEENVIRYGYTPDTINEINESLKFLLRQ